jgi:plasmid replication initiation protein
VVVGKIKLQTVALESIEAAPVLRMIDQLQMAGMYNTSYVRQLKQILNSMREYQPSAQTK